MRIDSLRHLAVIDPDTACRTGTVTDYWLNPTEGRLAALALRPVAVREQGLEFFLLGQSRRGHTEGCRQPAPL